MRRTEGPLRKTFDPPIPPPPNIKLTCPAAEGAKNPRNP